MYIFPCLCVWEGCIIILLAHGQELASMQRKPTPASPSRLGDREDFVTDFLQQCYIYTVERNELFQNISSCGPNISRFTSSWQICISRDLEWFTPISMGWQICPQFIWQAKKWYATVRDDSFCVSAAWRLLLCLVLIILSIESEYFTGSLT